MYGLGQWFFRCLGGVRVFLGEGGWGVRGFLGG